jgi:hypothetical protein
MADSMLWSGVYIACAEDRLKDLNAKDERALRWLKDQELIQELQWMGMWEHAERLEDIVGKHYTGEEH